MLLLLALACPEPDMVAHDKGPDTGDTAPVTDSGDSAELSDDDKDGFDSSEDCNDNDYQVYPGAPEACDAVDNDCDGATDEDFDADGDGAMDADACVDGTDCDDTDLATYAGAPEVPYDGLDQDCDGEDLVDVDGDRYDYTFDCDDDNPSVNPGAEEVPKNGIDDDCDGADSYDGDGDGEDDEAYGGDDCDDSDPAVFTGARDFWNDGLDTDCDGLDNRIVSLADASVSIVGVDGGQSLVGESVTFCDLDNDGLDDVIVTAPFASSYSGQIGIWYGSGSASWAAGMVMSDADSLLTSNDRFLGFGAQCGDFDGDGYLDLVTSRGEINAASYGYDTEYEILVFFGDGGKFDATFDEDEAGLRLERELGVQVNLLTVFASGFVVADLDGDGAAEITMHDSQDSRESEPTGMIYVVQGGSLTGTREFIDEAVAVIDPEVPAGITRLRVLDDVDGDGIVDWFLGATGFDVDTGDSADSGLSPGRGFWASTTMVDAALSELTFRTWDGRDGDAYGWDGLVLDDGTGTMDAVVVAIGYNDAAGALYFFDGLPSSGGPADAEAALLGTEAGAYFGYAIDPVPDMDGDGVPDIVVAEALAGEGDEGRVYVIGGAQARAGNGNIEDATLLAWAGDASEAYPGSALGHGDVDGDGVPDIGIGAQLYPDSSGNTAGSAYVLLSR